MSACLLQIPADQRAAYNSIKENTQRAWDWSFLVSLRPPSMLSFTGSNHWTDSSVIMPWQICHVPLGWKVGTRVWCMELWQREWQTQREMGTTILWVKAMIYWVGGETPKAWSIELDSLWVGYWLLLCLPHSYNWGKAHHSLVGMLSKFFPFNVPLFNRVLGNFEIVPII